MLHAIVVCRMRLLYVAHVSRCMLHDYRRWRTKVFAMGMWMLHTGFGNSRMRKLPTVKASESGNGFGLGILHTGVVRHQLPPAG